MTKIVSSAPPRASSSRLAAKADSSAPASPRKAGGRAASGSSSQVSLSFSFDEPAEVAPSKGTPSKAKPTVSKPTVSKTPTAKASSDAKVKPAKAEPKKAAVKKVVAKVEPTKPAVELKGKKVRAPKDLAVQYGGATEARPNLPIIVEAETPKKRLTKVQRDARKQLMKPDEGLLERLARATQIAIVKPKSEPRGKGWKFVCGRCGTTSYFQIPAALCDCGAIALKD